MSEMIQRVSFDTQDLPVTQRFDAWRALMAPAYEVTAQQGDFAARIDSINYGDMLIREISVARQTVARSPRQVRKDQIDHIVLCSVTDAFDFDAGNGMVRAPVGSFVLSACARPHVRGPAAEKGSRFLCLSRDVVAAVLPDPEAHHGRVLTDGFARLLTDHIDMLVRHAGSLTTDEIAGLGRATAHLLSAGLIPSSRSVGRARGVGDAAAAQRCKTIIERNLRSPALTPEMICRHAGVSRATLHRAFARQGGVSVYIRDRRLKAVRAALAAQDKPARISDIAYAFGFTNIPSFNRAFRIAFGVSPSEAVKLPFTDHVGSSTSIDWLDATLRV